MNGTRFFIAACALAFALDASSFAAQAPRSRVAQADFYVKEFEKEVQRERGGQKSVYRSQRDALTRVQELKTQYPDDEDVEALFQRVKTALMQSKGSYMQITPAMFAYKKNEEQLRQTVWAAGQKAWDEAIAKAKASGSFLEKTFPAPDSAKTAESEANGLFVVLDDVQYPANQFYGVTGEYIHVGKPSSGYYFVQINSRSWLGPYEAVKRYRRSVDSSMIDVPKWTLLGKITGLTAEIPQAGEEKIGAFQYGWIVTPVALMVPDHVAAFYNAEAETSGSFAGEDKVNAIKSGWYTVTSIPDDVTPERLCEIFMTAIKEKNYDLYLDCISPERRKSDTGKDRLRYHWDLHQERFHQQYVHATFGTAKISVLKGFDDNNDLENFFLDEIQRKTLQHIGGTKVEQAIVEASAWDENGKQVGSPVPRKLRRRGGGRWYIDEYEPRF